MQDKTALAGGSITQLLRLVLQMAGRDKTLHSELRAFVQNLEEGQGDAPNEAENQSDGACFAEEQAMEIDDFCRTNRISRSTYYNLKKEGLGPETFNAGTRVLITKEANREWRKKMAQREVAKKAETETA